MNRQSKIHWPSFAYFFLAAMSSLYLFNEKPARALQFLSYGYDNAFHFTLFRGLNETSWYPNVDPANWFTDLQLFTNVPLGYYALTSFISQPFYFIHNNPTNTLIFFASFQVFSIFLLIWLVFRVLTDPRINKIPAKILNALLSVVIVTCLASTLLVNGFAPYFWSLIIILIWLNFDSNNLVGWEKNLTLSLAIYSVTMITPAPAAILIIVALIIFTSEFLIIICTRKKIQSLLNILPFMAIGGLCLWSFTKSSAGLGWRQLLQHGGLQNINLVTTIVLFLIVIVLLARNIKKSTNNMLAIIVISSLLSAGLLTLLTVGLTGNLQYYAIKQIYLALFLSAIYAAKEFKSYSFKYFSYGILTMLMIVPILKPNFFTGGYMGVLPRVIAHTIEPSVWETEPVNAGQILNIEELTQAKNTNCYVWYVKDGFTDLDLSSRWVNSLKSTDLVSTKCFSGYWNNVGLSDSELQRKLANINANFVILTQKISIPTSTNNIKFEIVPISK
ncbi:hypothetical protein MCEMRE191_01400 [Candidatus Nanopelagicaceae bacterium]